MWCDSWNRHHPPRLQLPPIHPFFLIFSKFHRRGVAASEFDRFDTTVVRFDRQISRPQLWMKVWPHGGPSDEPVMTMRHQSQEHAIIETRNPTSNILHHRPIPWTLNPELGASTTRSRCRCWTWGITRTTVQSTLYPRLRLPNTCLLNPTTCLINHWSQILGPAPKLIPQEQKILKGHLPRVIYRQVYWYTKIISL